MEHGTSRIGSRERGRGHRTDSRSTSKERSNHGISHSSQRSRREHSTRSKERRRSRDRSDERIHRGRSRPRLRSRSGSNGRFRPPPSRGYEWGGSSAVEAPPEPVKINLGLSGNLLKDTNMYKGVVINYSQPPEARKPRKRWRLYPFKEGETIPFYQIHRESAYLFGRNRLIADIPIDHPSCSSQHAVLQYRSVECSTDEGNRRMVLPYLIDLKSSNGTFLNDKKIEPQRFYELREGDVLKFAFSTREYVILHEDSAGNKTDTEGEKQQDP